MQWEFRSLIMFVSNLAGAKKSTFPNTKIVWYERRQMGFSFDAMHKKQRAIQMMI
jgi:hypothetical protein